MMSFSSHFLSWKYQKASRTKRAERTRHMTPAPIRAPLS